MTDTLEQIVGRTIKDAVVAMLMDPRNEGHAAVLQAEIEFGSISFDTHFTHVPASNLLGFLRNYAADHEEGHGGIKDFLGCVDEYKVMPCESLARRMIEAAKRALNDYNDDKP